MPISIRQGERDVNLLIFGVIVLIQWRMADLAQHLAIYLGRMCVMGIDTVCLFMLLAFRLKFNQIRNRENLNRQYRGNLVYIYFRARNHETAIINCINYFYTEFNFHVLM